MLKTNKAFTLIEILVVVALIAILAAITYIAINPAKNFADTRNAQRSADVLQILNAVTQYTATQGNTLAGLGTIPLCSSSATPIGTNTSNINLTTTLVDTYIVGIPLDPSTGTAGDTGYDICKTAGNRVTIKAPDAENGKTIAASR